MMRSERKGKCAMNYTLRVLGLVTVVGAILSYFVHAG